MFRRSAQDSVEGGRSRTAGLRRRSGAVEAGDRRAAGRPLYLPLTMIVIRGLGAAALIAVSTTG